MARDRRTSQGSAQPCDALVRAGRRDDVARVYESTGRRAQAAYRQVRDDTSRNDEWKVQQIAKLHAGFREAMVEELTAMARSADYDDCGHARSRLGTHPGMHVPPPPVEMPLSSVRGHLLTKAGPT
jgi:hypothetical protein